MSDFQHFWCRINYSDEPNWAIINLDKISAIRFPKSENEFYYVDLDGDITFLFSRREVDRLLSAMGRCGHRLFDEDGNRV